MWFVVSLSAYFLLSAAAITDKFLLNKTKIVPVSFAFYITFLGSILGSFLLFFSPSVSLKALPLGPIILGGFALFLGLYFMFLTIAKSEVSKANPLIVSFIPLAVFLLSLILRLELVSLVKIIGVALVVGGGYFLSQLGQLRSRIKPLIWLFILLASLFLGAANVYGKMVYDQLPFITGFVALRWSSLAGALLFVLLFNQWPAIFFKNSKKTEKKPAYAWLVFGFGQLAGSLGVILLQYAIALGNVILVTALNGLQFLFVILLVYLLSKFFPKILQEEIIGRYFWKKIGWSLILSIGVVLILI